VSEQSEKMKKVESDVKKVRRMYDLAQSNEATTQRSDDERCNLYLND